MATYRVPRELDILPPRPVLFPYLPSAETFDCCFGGDVENQTPEPNDTKEQSSTTIDDVDDYKEASETTITTIDTADDCTSSIPDMSSLSGYSEVDRYRSFNSQDCFVHELPDQNHYNRNKPLVSLEDVISLMLQMIFQLLAAKKFLLGESESHNQIRNGRIQADLVDSGTKEAEETLS